jgi:hypothetical protein
VRGLMAAGFHGTMGFSCALFRRLQLHTCICAHGYTPITWHMRASPHAPPPPPTPPFTPANLACADADGYVKAATGGEPMNLNGGIYLCTRSDKDPQVG